MLLLGFPLRYDSHVMTWIYLERVDHARNMARYYRLSVVETLFGEYAMVREWGRIGGGGQSREHVCLSEEDAENLLQRHRTLRIGRGYR